MKDSDAMIWDNIGKTQGHSYGDHIAWSSLVSILIQNGTVSAKELLDNLQSSIDAVAKIPGNTKPVPAGVTERLVECTKMVSALSASKGGK